jgi:hypothetical protein
VIDVPHYHLVPKELGANLRFRKALLEEAGRDVSTAAQLRTMCADDLLFYVNAFGWTYDPRSKVKVAPFVTYPFQDEAMLELVRCVEDGRDAAMPKSRDMGASWMGLTVIEWLWHFRPNLSFLLVSRNENYVDKRGDPKSLFWKIDFLHKHQPMWLLPRNRWLGDKDPGRKSLHLHNADNSSVIDGEATTGDAGRGDRRTAMFIDEHAAFELDDGFRVLRATRDTTNCRIFNSTPQGASNGFYEVVHKTAAKVLRLHWSKHPEKARGLYTTDEKNGKLVLLDDWRGKVTIRRKGEEPRVVRFPEDYPFELDRNDQRFRSPWYDDQCARCVSPQEIAQELDIDFIGSDFPFFDPKFIEILRKRDARPPLHVGFLEFDDETLQPKRFVEHPKGNVELWIPLGRDDRPPKDLRFSIGVDVSAGTGASNSVAVAANMDTGEKVARFRTPNMRPHEFAGATLAFAYFFNKGFVVPDASGPTGQTFIKRLIAAAYGNTYYRKNEKKVTQTISDEPGYYLNAQARATLLEDYRAALSERRYVNRSDEGLAECLQFVRTQDGVEHTAAANSQDPSGARTAHGDEVIADALASLGVSERRREQKAEEPTTPVGSLAWRMEARKAAARAGKDELGEGW